jgi:hypothetical protein
VRNDFVKYRLIGYFIVLLFCAPFADAAEIELQGSLETLHALPFSADRGLTDSRTTFTGDIKVFAGETTALVSLQAEYNGASPDRTGFLLGEAWADWSAGGFNLRLGRQLVSWGAADGLILTDVVCPQNLSAYAGLDFAGSRLAVDGLRLRYSFSSIVVEALWLPLFTPARLPDNSENPLRGIFFPSSVEMNGMSIPVVIDRTDLPLSIKDGEYGLRFSWYTHALDFSLAAFYGWNDIPFTEKKLSFTTPPVPDKLVVSPGYARTITAGADASIPLGPVLLRLEAAWTGGSRYDPSAADLAAILSRGESAGPVEKQNIKALAGIDWTPRGWTLSAQYYEDILPDAGNGGTERPWRKNAVTLQIARAFFRETLDLSVSAFLDLIDFDSAINAAAAYALTDSLSLTLGGEFFSGGIDDRGTYSAYKELSCMWIKGVFRF